MIRFALFFLAVTSLASAEITISTSTAKALTGLVSPRQVGSVYLIGDDSKPSVASVCLVKVVTPARFVDVSAKRFVVKNGVIQIESATATDIGTREYMLSGSGSYSLEVIAFDPVNGIDRKSIEITIGLDPDPAPEPKPVPPPGPVPDVPNDYNVGQIAYKTAPANDAAMARQIASWYRVGASKLFGGGGLADIETIRNQINAQFAGKQCKDKATCEQWDRWKAAVSQALTAEQIRRKTFTRQDHYTAMIEVATALEARN